MSEFIRTFVENLRRQVKVDAKWAIELTILINSIFIN